ncbi:MAG: NADH-quinone oxidoreductase subunit N [Parachlamydiaceae bacterium]|nr:NADH-quinone oxidoreductase subunit N [Parachlamydiaceae bacterium]
METTLTSIDIAALSPLLILLGGALSVLLLETFAGIQAKKYSFYLTLIFFLIALHAAFLAPTSENTLLTPWLRFDSIARFFTVFFIAIGICSTLLASAFFRRFEATHGEYYFLLFSSVFGLVLIGYSADFLTLFLGIETLSISLYILCGYMKKWNVSHEAAIKYFFIGAIGAAFLLYGIALVYGAVGTTRFEGLLNAYQNISNASDNNLFLGGIALITLGLAFKAAIVPFHVWAPDVYDGAPTPVTAFMAVGTKVGAFAAFVRVFLIALPGFNPLWNQCMALLAFPTLIFANFVALRQKQLRRFFAYSGISHSGYLLILLAVGTAEAIPAIIFYLVIYAFATLGAFAVIATIDNRSEGVMIKDLQGLFQRKPLLAAVLALCLLTLAGIPPTAGFFAKFYVFKLGYQAGYHALVILALLTTILSAFYYLRIVATMFVSSNEEKEIETTSWPAMVMGLVSVVAILILSLYPEPLMTLLSH